MTVFGDRQSLSLFFILLPPWHIKSEQQKKKGKQKNEKA